MSKNSSISNNLAQLKRAVPTYFLAAVKMADTGSPANVLLCDKVETPFSLLRSLFDKGKYIKPLIRKSTTAYIVPLLFFYNDGFGIRYSIKADIPLKKETTTNIIHSL